MGAHAGGGFGAVIFLFVLLLMPPFWVSVAYVVGVPLAFAFVGHAMAFKSALQHALRKKSDVIAEGICALSWPVAERLAAMPGTTTVNEGTRALLNQFENMRDTSRLTRWFLGRAIRVLKIAEIFTTTDLLARSKTEPDAARQTLRSAIEARMREATSGGIFARAWLLSAVVIVITLTRRFWIDWYQ